MTRTRRTLTAVLTIAVVIACLTLIARGQDGQRRFSDVPADHPQAQAIQQASRHGWINGYPDGTFRPGEPIKAGQIRTVIDRIINNDYPDGMTRSQFAELITDTYPNPDLKLENYQSLGVIPPKWSVQVIVPIIPDSQIRWKYTGNPGRGWTSSNKSSNNFTIQYGPEQEQNIIVYVQYQNDDTLQRLQIIKFLSLSGCHPEEICWHPEFRICVSDVAIYNNSCWITDQQWRDI